MTTIAYRDGVLAADTLTTVCNGLVEGYTSKIAKKGRYLASAAGSAAYGMRFRDWFTAGMIGDPPAIEGQDNYGAAIFTPDGLILKFHREGWEAVRGPFWADGSGWEVAMGAMHMGATAEEAVRAAMKVDTKTGGEVTVLRHG